MTAGSATLGDVAVLETVLLVEDDIIIRSSIAAYLRDCGYRVIEAADPAEAMTVLEKGAMAIQVVLTDIDMPGDIDGFALAQWIRRRLPGIEVVMAGTPGRAAAAAGELCERGPMLAKPYEPQAVLDRIRQLLARRQPQT